MNIPFCPAVESADIKVEGEIDMSTVLNKIWKIVRVSFFVSRQYIQQTWHSDIYFSPNYKNAAHYLCLEHFVGYKEPRKWTCFILNQIYYVFISLH